MPPTPTELYGMHSPLDFRQKWNQHHHPLLHQHQQHQQHHDLLFDDGALGAIPPSADAHLEGDMMSMLMHTSFEFLPPSLDPAALGGPLSSPTYPLDQSVMLSDAAATVDPWSLSPYQYLDLSPHPGGLLSDHAPPPPQLTPNMSSSGESSVNSTPQLGHPHFGLGPQASSRSFMQHLQEQQQQQQAQFAGSSMPLFAQGIDTQDPRLAAALAMCDPYGATGGSSHHTSLHHPLSAHTHMGGHLLGQHHQRSNSQ